MHYILSRKASNRPSPLCFQSFFYSITTVLIYMQMFADSDAPYI